MQTENLKKHIEELEEKRLSAFFHMQALVTDLNQRIYHYNMYMGFSAIALLITALCTTHADAFLVMWSKIFAMIVVVSAFAQHLFLLDRNASRMFADIRTIYASYDNEYVVLRKFDSGEINEDLIRQYYIDKSKKLERFSYNISTPSWITWLTLSLLIASLMLLVLA